MISVILADDRALVREATRWVLEVTDDIEIVAEADNGLDAVRLAQELKPDVVLLDITMPGMDGCQAAAKIRELGLELPIIMLSMHSHESVVRECLKSGINGYVIKHSATELPLAIRAVQRGETYFSSVVSGMVEHYPNPTAVNGTAGHLRFHPTPIPVYQPASNIA